MGKYPVVFLSLKDVDGLNFNLAYERFARTIRRYADTVRYLQDSSALDDKQKAEFEQLLDIKYLSDPKHLGTLGSSLGSLMLWLHLHYGVAPMVLIDEYDVPLAKAHAHGYYDEMLDLLRDFMGALKTNDHFSRAVLTGCLRVSKESIFTGLNNFTTNSILDEAW